MMQLLIVFALMIAIFFVLFALQNAELVTIDLIVTQVESSLALILLITLALGIVIGLLVSSYSIISKTLEISKQNKQIKELEKSLNQPEINKKVPAKDLPSNQSNQNPTINNENPPV